jgi:hypothetical protein
MPPRELSAASFGADAFLSRLVCLQLEGMAPMGGSENSTIGGPSRAPPWLHHNYPSRCPRVATYHDPFCPCRFAKTDPGSAGCLKSRPIGHRSFGCRGDNCILHSVLNSPTRNDHDHSALVPPRRFSFKTYSEILYRPCERARKVSACYLLRVSQTTPRLAYWIPSSNDRPPLGIPRMSNLGR